MEYNVLISEMLRLWYRELLISILVSPLVIWKSGLFRNRTVGVLSKKSPVFCFFRFIYLFFGCDGSSFAVCRLSLVAASGGYSLLCALASRCSGFSYYSSRRVGLQ